MDVIIRTIVKGMFPFIILFGLFIIFHGHLSPGGSFPGGAIVASGFALVAVAFGVEKAERLMSENAAHIIEGIVAMILVILLLYESFIGEYVGITGEMFGFWSAPEILSLNIVGGVMVMCALTLIVFLMIKE
ncbi:MAG: MnhB domain-containing protein [Candidatus Aenigmarchaeota archaeon]